MGTQLRQRVPARSLLLSLAALMIPLVATLTETVAKADLVGEELEMLIWLPALLPAFLLTYYRGWSGASVALALGMATLALSQSVVWLLAAEPPSPRFLLVLVISFVLISLAIGQFGELLHRARRHAEAAALRDPLTGLPNRAHLRLFLDTAFGAAERGGALTVVLFDIDHFKAVNDQHGHPAGDETLRVFADILEVQTRRSDLTARFGGEEFLSVLTGPGAAAGARIFAERVRGSLHDAALPWGPIAASAGIAQYHDSIASPDILLAEVDRALYHAKGTGRDRVVASSEIPPATEPQPVADASVGPTPSPAERGRPSRVPGAPSHILIVEDDTFMREGLSRILRRSGFHTSMAEDGAAALAHLESDGVPDLILSDLVMPGMGGLTLADRAHQLCPGIRILLVSGYEHDRVMDNVPESVVGFLKKPLTPKELVGFCRELVRGRNDGRTGGQNDGVAGPVELTQAPR